MNRIAKLSLSVLLTVGLIAIPVASRAENQGELSISPSIETVEKSYPSIDGQKGSAGGLFASFRPPGCEQYAYCDTIKLNVFVPEGYREIFYVEVVLSYDKGPTDNRVDLHIWGDDDPALGAPIASDAGAHQPKKAKVGEPPTGPLWITVVNITGVNSGYKLTVSWKLTDLGPDYRKQSPLPSPSPTPKKSPTPAKPVALPSPSPETIKVKVPGPDGQPTEIAIPLVKTQGVAKRADEEGGSPIVALVLAALGAGLGIFIYLFVWRRRRA